MAIVPGTLDKFDGSMAAAIETELNALLEADLLPPLPMGDTPDRRDRRRLFVAIARGVVRHLKENEASFKVTYQPVAAPTETNVVLDAEQ